MCRNPKPIAGQKWLTSWGYTTQPAEDNDKLIDLGERAAKAMKAVHGRVYEVEPAAGFYPAGAYVLHPRNEIH